MVKDKYSEDILEVRDVIMAFGGLMALANLNCRVKNGIIKAICPGRGACTQPIEPG